MDDSEVDVLADIALSDPVLIEGLPGVGHVGKLAANHLVDEFDGTEVARLHSQHFPPQVGVDDDGIASLSGATFHAVETEAQDLLVVTADHQAQTNEGHYQITNAILDVAQDHGVSEAYALGGVPTGELIEEYDVIGAASDEEMVERLTEEGVEFREGEPAGGIVGVSGLLLGLGAREDLTVGCLMGETSGYLVDPKSAQAVLELIESLFSLSIDYTDLEERAEEMEEVVSKIQEMESQQASQMPTDDDLRYIG